MTDDPAGGLSCYTANLAAYLDALGVGDGAQRLAASVRLAVRIDRDGLVSLAHHDPTLDELGDGTRLSYAGTDRLATARLMLGDEIALQGRALVVVYSNQVPWAVASPEAVATPHFLLVDGHRAGRWHVVDHFRGLLASGEEQGSHEGWLDDAELAAAQVRTGPAPAKHRLRNTLVFGRPVPVPSTEYLMLRRSTDAPSARPLGPGWWTDTAQALNRLGKHLAGERGLLDDPDVVDDCWAAAQHHTFRYRRLLAGDVRPDERADLVAALDAWTKVPRTLRFALASARRGRPRGSLVTKLFAELAVADAAARDLYGRRAGTPPLRRLRPTG